MKMIVALLLIPVFLVACDRNEVKTYQVPKEQTVLPVAESTAAAQHEAPPVSDRFEAVLPETWKEMPGSGMRMVSYAIDGTSIDFYLISLSMGDVPSNVNRWRGQVGLPEATAEAINTDVEALEVDGHAVSYIEIYNEEDGKGIIAAIIDLAPSYWYFTAKGSVDELKENAADIRAFIGSIKFEGHNH